MKFQNLIFCLAIVCQTFLVIACSDNESDMMEVEEMEKEMEEEMENEEEENPCLDFICIDDLSPIIMMHGFLGSGDTYAGQIQRFRANEYPADHLYTFDWNSLAGSNTELLLDALVDEVLAATNKDKVILAGHSAGGGVGYTYMSDDVRSKKVDRYIHIASNPNSSLPGPENNIPTLNIWSTGDLVVSGGDIEGANNVMIPEQDHYQIATSPETFSNIFQFIHNKEPKTTNALASEEPEVGGIALTFGENQPASEVSIDIYAIDEKGSRVNEDTPAQAFTTDDKGRWGPFVANPDYQYEFVLSSSDPDFRTIHYYRESFDSDNANVYLRTFPGPGSLAGLFLSAIPSSDDQSVAVIFSSSQAVISGRDNLSIEGTTLSTSSLAAENKTAIAFFLYDNDDQESSLEAIPAFSTFPFLSGADYYIDTQVPAVLDVSLNGRSVKIKNWKSSSEGVSVVVFD